MEFNNKVVLVTGASAGIGEATAILFAKKGAKLALVGRNKENLIRVAGICEKEKGNKPLIVIADLGTDEGVEKTAKTTLDHFGRLDVLVNNAAVGARACIETADMETFDRLFSVNVRGVYNLTRKVVPALIKYQGNIVNVSSISATMVADGNLPYSMTKAAIDHFTRIIAVELAPKGVRVNAVSPGLTVTKFVTRMTNYTEEEYQVWLANLKPSIPMGKICTGDQIAKMIVHLASDDSELVTGTVVQVDGGLNLSGLGNGNSVMKNHHLISSPLTKR